jgi:hypothetical protein
MSMNFEELQEQGWSDFQQVDGRWWGFPPGAVMPVPVGRPGNPLSNLRGGILSHRHENGWLPDTTAAGIFRFGHPVWRSPVYGDSRLPVTTELTEAELKINAAIKKAWARYYRQRRLEQPDCVPPPWGSEFAELPESPEAE